MTDHSGLRTDAELVAAAAAGSDLAFRTLYRSYVRAVYAVAHALVGTATDAEDVGHRVGDPLLGCRTDFSRNGRRRCGRRR